MARVAGVDGAPDGWAVVTCESGPLQARRVADLCQLIEEIPGLDLIAIDVPIGLLDGYEIGGRACDRKARKLLQKRASSVFPAPVRAVLEASSWEDACIRSRASASRGKKISKQTFGILPKIKEVDDLLRTRPELRDVVREVHPEVCFRELAGCPMRHSKKIQMGKNERREALRKYFPDLDVILSAGKKEDLLGEDIIDAAVAYWSALRLADGKGRSLIEPFPHDTTGLPMTIWV